MALAHSHADIAAVAVAVFPQQALHSLVFAVRVGADAAQAHRARLLLGKAQQLFGQARAAIVLRDREPVQHAARQLCRPLAVRDALVAFFLARGERKKARKLRAVQHTRSGIAIPRVPSHVYNLEDEAEFAEFARGESVSVPVYGSDECIPCDTRKRLGIITSRIGTSTATPIGAYCFALHKIDSNL